MAMLVKVKKIDKNAVMPKKAHMDDAGWDLTAISREFDKWNDNVIYGTGLAIEIPKGYVGLLFPRSSNSRKELLLSNSVGVIDSCYRGEITFHFRRTYKQACGTTTHRVQQEYNIGDRIGQLVIIPYPEIEFELSTELSETERGTGGYGSTGK
jgi:dUTP pyrophosphatase